jgi:hypothetical protein
MSPTLTEHAGTGISPPVKPSVWRVGWAAFLGYLFTFLGGLPLVFLTLAVGIDVLGGEGRGAFERYDVWSWLAEACVGLFATVFTAWAVAWQLRERTGWEVPLSFTFLTLLLTGYAPLLALTPFYWAAAPVSLVAATLILRWRCEPAGAEPRALLSVVPRRYRRQAVIALGVSLPLIAGYALAYGTTHPLHWDGSVGFSPNGTAITHASDPPRYQRDPGAIERYVFGVKNIGRFDVDDVTLTAVEGDPVFQLEFAGLRGAGRTPWVRGALNPLSEVRLPARETRYLVLEFRQGRTCVGPTAQLDAVRLRFSVLGGAFEERLPLLDPPTIRC